MFIYPTNIISVCGANLKLPLINKISNFELFFMTRRQPHGPQTGFRKKEENNFHLLWNRDCTSRHAIVVLCAHCHCYFFISVRVGKKQLRYPLSLGKMNVDRIKVMRFHASRRLLMVSCPPTSGH